MSYLINLFMDMQRVEKLFLLKISTLFLFFIFYGNNYYIIRLCFRWLKNKGIVTDIDAVDIEPKAILGKDISKDVAKANLKCSWVKLTELTKGQNNIIKIAQTL